MKAEIWATQIVYSLEFGFDKQSGSHYLLEENAIKDIATAIREAEAAARADERKACLSNIESAFIPAEYRTIARRAIEARVAPGVEG